MKGEWRHLLRLERRKEKVGGRRAKGPARGHLSSGVLGAVRGLRTKPQRKKSKVEIKFRNSQQLDGIKNPQKRADGGQERTQDRAPRL